MVLGGAEAWVTLHLGLSYVTVLGVNGRCCTNYACLFRDHSQCHMGSIDLHQSEIRWLSCKVGPQANIMTNHGE